MQIVVTTRPIRLNGEVVQPGATIKVAKGHGLIEKGYARKLTRGRGAGDSQLLYQRGKGIFNEPRQATRPQLAKYDTHNATQDSLPFDREGNHDR